MVGNHDGGGAGFHSLLGAGHGHDALDDEGHFGVVHDLLHLVNRLAAGVGVHGLQEGQARAVHVHGRGENVVLVQNIQLFKHKLLVPGLDGGAADTAVFHHIHHGAFHDVRVHAVAGEGHDAVLIGSLDEDGVILLILVLGAVVHVQCAQGSGEDGGAEFPAEQGKGDVRGGVGAEGVHVDANLLPLVKVPGGHIAGVLAAGAGHGIAAGAAVADGASLTVGADTVPGGSQNLIVIHVLTLLFCF